MLLAVAFLIGIATWSFSEYALHNWVFHGPRGKRAYNAEHLDHHATQSYFAPTWKKVIAGLVVLGPIAVPAGLLFGAPGLSWLAGVASSYVAYEVVHRRCHTHPPRGPYSRFIRKHHFHHHYHAPTKNHGVTSPIWDWVLGTYERPGVIRVPEKQVMQWLCDPETGEVDARYASDYRIAWKKHRSTRQSASAGSPSALPAPSVA